MEGRLRAKMRVGAVTTKDYGTNGTTCKDIEATAVCGDENKPWSQFTPSGLLKLVVTNPDAFGTIDELAGKEIYVDIIVVDAE